LQRVTALPVIGAALLIMASSINQFSDPAGDIAQVYTLFQRPIVAYLTRLVEERETAEDLYQETFEKAILHWASLNEPARRRAWLYRIATNTAYDYLRRRKRTNTVPLDALEEAPDERDTPDLQVELSASVHAVLAQLPPQYRQALLLFICGGQTTQEIASALGCSDLAIRLRLLRGRTRFKQLYTSAQ